jgi:hypothetical protein
MGGINDDADARRYIGMGSRFITTGSDHGYIVAGSLARAKFLRGLAVGGADQAARTDVAASGASAKSKKKAGKKKDREAVPA